MRSRLTNEERSSDKTWSRRRHPDMEGITILTSICNGFTWIRYATKKKLKSRHRHAQRCVVIHRRRLASVRGSNSLAVPGWSALLILESPRNQLHQSTRESTDMASFDTDRTRKTSPKSGLQASTLTLVVAGGYSRTKSDLPVTYL